MDNKKQKLVYVVDDDKNLANLVSEFATVFGNRPKVFYSPIKAMKNLENGDKPDILITDFNMPKMTGLELSEIMLKYSPSTYRFLHTGNHGIEDYLKESLSNGVIHRYDFKPISLKSIKSILKGEIIVPTFYSNDGLVDNSIRSVS